MNTTYDNVRGWAEGSIDVAENLLAGLSSDELRQLKMRIDADTDAGKSLTVELMKMVVGVELAYRGNHSEAAA
jgi:hypothetical protein